MRDVNLRLLARLCAPGFVFLVAWEVFVYSDARLRFLLGSPHAVILVLWTDIVHGSYALDFLVTLAESAAGLVGGSVAGAGVGLLLWLSPMTARIAKPYVAALGAVPTFALAPMMILWFGTGFFGKAMMAGLATVFVALVQTYEGAKRADSEFLGLVRGFGGTRWQGLRWVVIPGTLSWIVVSCRLNVGFAILGAFVGEFIVSNRGLAHYILRASSLYDVPRVLAGVAGLVVMAGLLLSSVRALERWVVPWVTRGGSER